MVDILDFSLLATKPAGFAADRANPLLSIAHTNRRARARQSRRPNGPLGPVKAVQMAPVCSANDTI